MGERTMTYCSRPLRIVVQGLLVLSGVFLLIWTSSALARRAPSEEALRYFDREFLKAATERATRYYVTWAVQNAAVMLTAWALVRSGFIVNITENVLRRTGLAISSGTGGMLLGGILASLFWFTATSLVSLPFRYYCEQYLERFYGLSRMTAAQWFADYGKSFLLTALVTALSGGVLALMMARSPRAWPYLAAAGVLALSLVISYIYPVVVAPMFYRFRPLEDPGLLADIRDLGVKAAIEVSKVLVMEASQKTTRPNAYFAGFGGTKQVVVYDTLLSGTSRGQAKLVLAHEMSHYKHSHVLKGVILSSAGALVVFMLFNWALRGGPRGVSARALRETTPATTTIAALVMLLLFSSLVEFVTAPASNWVSRRFEMQADLDSLAWAGDVRAFVESQIKLARGNLSDVEPPAFIRWFAWTHPTTLERIEMGIRGPAS